jgi:DNA-directed RNA polymerase specialized sigma24 family protein/CheY-like chemotaxis protein
MSLATEIKPHLPYLRRFARALTGGQQSGDAYVAMLLETLVADPSSLGDDKPVRIGLYAMLCKLWGSLKVNQRADAHGPRWEATAQNRLAAIPPRPRQAFLLTSVEGFSIDETAAILGTDADGVTALLEDASREIGEMIAADVLVIEDEPLIAMDIEDIVTGLGHSITGIARTREQAVQLALRKRPGLVLADIQLADGSSGIDAVNDMLRQFEVPVIFITAYPERLLTGERPEPAFLITKPFLPEMVKAMISQALFFDLKSSPRMERAANG